MKHSGVKKKKDIYYTNYTTAQQLLHKPSKIRLKTTWKKKPETKVTKRESWEQTTHLPSPSSHLHSTARRTPLSSPSWATSCSISRSWSGRSWRISTAGKATVSEGSWGAAPCGGWCWRPSCCPGQLRGRLCLFLFGFPLGEGPGWSRVVWIRVGEMV